MTKQSEISPAKGIKKLESILENAIATDFEGALPGEDYKPEFESLPKLDRDLYRLDRNDYNNAQRLVKRFGKNLMFLYDTGWCGWNGKYWSIKDGPYIAKRYAGETAEAMKGEVTALWVEGPRADEEEDKFKKRLKAFHKFAVSSGNYPRQRAMLENAQGRLLVEMSELDALPDLLNLQNGTLNLNAGEDAAKECGDQETTRIVLQKHNRKHKITRIADTDYVPGTESEKFEKFIRQVMPDDEIRLFLQRYFGYALTGHANEQVFVMFQGEGSNGKSTLLRIMQDVLGDYAMATPFGTLVRNENKKGSDASPDLARLPGARLVVASEPAKGVELDDGTVKMLTGEDKTPVRDIYEGFFEFNPTFKLCVACNNKPYIRATDDGIWRRILLVKFEERFVDEEDLKKFPNAHLKDMELEEKLKDEYPGILNWMIEGYRMWKDTGLKIPEKIRAATAEYRNESNQAYPFVSAWCERLPGAKIQASRLYDAYKLWCKQGGKDPLARNSFGTKMKALKIEKEESNYHYYLGIQLTQEAEDNLLAEERKSWNVPDD